MKREDLATVTEIVGKETARLPEEYEVMANVDKNVPKPCEEVQDNYTIGFTTPVKNVGDSQDGETERILTGLEPGAVSLESKVENKVVSESAAEYENSANVNSQVEYMNSESVKSAVEYENSANVNFAAKYKNSANVHSPAEYENSASVNKAAEVVNSKVEQSVEYENSASVEKLKEEKVESKSESMYIPEKSIPDDNGNVLQSSIPVGIPEPCIPSDIPKPCGLTVGRSDLTGNLSDASPALEGDNCDIDCDNKHSSDVTGFNSDKIPFARISDDSEVDKDVKKSDREEREQTQRLSNGEDYIQMTDEQKGIPIIAN